eukprot:1916102-Rhodomonas_salina.1
MRGGKGVSVEDTKGGEGPWRSMRGGRGVQGRWAGGRRRGADRLGLKKSNGGEGRRGGRCGVGKACRDTGLAGRVGGGHEAI